MVNYGKKWFTKIKVMHYLGYVPSGVFRLSSIADKTYYTLVDY